MIYFRIEVSTDINVIGVFPQRIGIISNLKIDDSNHLFRQPPFTILNQDIYIPSFKLHSKANLTDVISLPIHNDWIIFPKLKNIFEIENIQNIQILPVTIFKNDYQYEYFILRSVLPQMIWVDYLHTDIFLKNALTRDDEIINVQDYEAFSKQEMNLEYPDYLEFKSFKIRTDCNLKYFTLKYTYGLNAHFINEDFKEILIGNQITGIRYMELDEVL